MGIEETQGHKVFNYYWRILLEASYDSTTLSIYAHVCTVIHGLYVAMIE